MTCFTPVKTEGIAVWVFFSNVFCVSIGFSDFNAATVATVS